MTHTNQILTNYTIPDTQYIARDLQSFGDLRSCVENWEETRKRVAAHLRRFSFLTGLEKYVHLSPCGKKVWVPLNALRVVPRGWKVYPSEI